MIVRRPVCRYHGGKWKLAPWIVSHFPTHRIYVEPFGGAASVLLSKPRSYAEIYNDLDGEMVNLFRVIRDCGNDLLKRLDLTPYSREDFNRSFIPADDPIEQAVRTLVRSYMGYGGNLTRPNRDQTPQRTGFRSNSNRSGTTPAHDWANYPSNILAIINRMKGVVIENRDARKVMMEHDDKSALHYVDPPYVHSTRGFGAGGTHRAYRHEMSDDAHRDLAKHLKELKGGVIISGYDSPLYQELFGDWQIVHRRSHADGARKRVETLWISQNVPIQKRLELA